MPETEEPSGTSRVDEYIEALPREQRAALTKLRGSLRAAAPEATETISYQMPAFMDQGRFLVSYAAFKDHCSLFPASEGVRTVLGDAIAPYLSGKGTIRFRPDQPLSAALVKRIVAIRLEENEALRQRAKRKRR